MCALQTHQLVVVRVQGLQPGVRVVFRVRYRNGVGWSCWSRPSASIDTSPAVPDTPMACSVAAKVGSATCACPPRLLLTTFFVGTKVCSAAYYCSSPQWRSDTTSKSVAFTHVEHNQGKYVVPSPCKYQIQIQRRQVHAGLLWDEDGSWETDQVRTVLVSSTLFQQLTFPGVGRRPAPRLATSSTVYSTRWTVALWQLLAVSRPRIECLRVGYIFRGK